jgi:hypothetical protein
MATRILPLLVFLMAVPAAAQSIGHTGPTTGVEAVGGHAGFIATASARRPSPARKAQ